MSRQNRLLIPKYLLSQLYYAKSSKESFRDSNYAKPAIYLNLAVLLIVHGQRLS